MRRRTNDNTHRYQMRQNLVAIGDDFWIEDEGGKRVYHVDGKALTIGDRLIFKDVQGVELITIREKLMRLKDTMEIQDPDGKTLATIKKDLINVLRDHWTIKINGQPDLDVTGNVLDYNYCIKQGHQDVARITKKWFRMRDTYGVEVQPDQDDVLILAATVALDMVVHN